MRSLALLLTVAACADGSTGTDQVMSTQSLSGATFTIHALGNRCIGLGPRKDTGIPLVIQKCDGTKQQQFSTTELSGHDIQIVPLTLQGYCATVAGPIAAGTPLVASPCISSLEQRFAYDGDALLVGLLGNKDSPITRDFAIEYRDSNTNEGTPVVVGARDLDDAEYWTFVPDKPGLRPHSGFVTVTTEAELIFDILSAQWGQVLELDPKDDATVIMLEAFPFKTITLPSGVTLRGGRKFMSNGVLLDVPDDRNKEVEYLLKLADYSRVTQLRLEGFPFDGLENATSALQIGDKDPPAQQQPSNPTHVIVDHVELSKWSFFAVGTFGPYNTDYSLQECPKDKLTGGLNAQIVGNFLHDNAYGVAVAQGGYALIRGNTMYKANHHITSGFYNGWNRYLAFDNLFDDHENPKNAVLDVHGSCGFNGGHWGGGVAGYYFEAAFNSFLTERAPMVNVRGTPCDHFSFHDNVSLLEGTSETLSVETALQPDEANQRCLDFVPGDPGTILQVSPPNAFDIENPLYQKLAVGDFDGDGHDDVFVGTGATWWFSSGGKAEWRLLNRMPQRVSDLIFGDFDADGRTDVVTLIDDRLMVSWAGASRWFPLTNKLPNMTIQDIAVGQFDADPRADLFFGDGSQWFWAPAGGPWQTFGLSSYRVADLKFGDFTGDGLTDIFNAANGTWKIVPGVWQPWQDLGSAQLPGATKDLVVADVTGDGIADVVANRTVGAVQTWSMSKGGTGSAAIFAFNDQALVSLPIGRFDDLDGADVLPWHDDWWFEITSPFVDEVWSRQFMR